MKIPNIFEEYKRICYIIGHNFDRNPNDSIARMIYQADVEMTPGMFTSLWLISTIICAGFMFIISALVFLAPWSPFKSLNPWIFILGLTIVAGAAVGIGFPFYLQNQVTNKKMDIDRKLPYALSFMSILASSNTTPLEIIRRIVREDYGHISKEFSKVLFRVDVLGEDAVTAMNSLVNNTPSDLFRDICMDFTNIIYGGSGLTEYLATKSKELMNIRRQTYKEFVESLAMFGEGYLGGIIMVLTMSVLGIVLSGALGIQLGPFTPTELWTYLIYLITPLVNIIFLLMLGVKYSGNT
jgi:flagellar protein FlaJ